MRFLVFFFSLFFDRKLAREVLKGNDYLGVSTVVLAKFLHYLKFLEARSVLVHRLLLDTRHPASFALSSRSRTICYTAVLRFCNWRVVTTRLGVFFSLGACVMTTFRFLLLWLVAIGGCSECLLRGYYEVARVSHTPPRAAIDSLEGSSVWVSCFVCLFSR
jgi:hypothetical protein